MSAHFLHDRNSRTIGALPPTANIGTGSVAWLTHLLSHWSLSLRVLESRRMLRELDDRMLSDIGISRCDAETESNRMPWDLPPDLGNRPRR